MSNSDDDEALRELIQTIVRETHRVGFNLTREEASNIALAAAKEAVRQEHEHFFGLIGYDIANKEDQKRLRANMEFLNEFREGTKNAQTSVAKISFVTLVSALLYALYLGAKVAITGKAF